MFLPRKYSSIVILVVTCLIPSLSLVHNISDGKLPQKLKLTEIRRVMKDGEVNAKNHHTKIVMTGLEKKSGEFNCTLFLYNGDSSSGYTYLKTINILDTTIEVVFEKPLKDALHQVLVIKDSDGNNVDAWTGSFEIRDLKARVAVVGDSDNNNFLRVTTGEYLETVVVDNTNDCSKENSPCYYRKKTLTIPDPSTIERCVTLNSTDSKKETNETLLHCDDTYSDFIAIPENTEPTRLLLESTLHLIYMLPSVTAEVLMVDPNTGDLIPNVTNGFNCTNNEEGCSIDLKIEGRQNINFIVVYDDDDDYVNGSMTYPFENFEVAMTQLTTDAAMTTWSPSKSGSFDVLITTRKDLVEPNFYCNRECDVSDAKNGGNCEAFFVIKDEKGKEYFAIIRPKENNGKNAIGIPILSNGTFLDSIAIFKIVRTPEADIKTTVTFNSTTQPKSMKLVEITINSTEVTNTEYMGQVSQTFARFKFQSSKDFGGFDRDKHFLLIRYDKNGGIQEVGEAFVTWRSSSVQLDWVGEPSAAFSALREVVSSGTTHIEKKYECNDVNGTCYFLEFPYGSETLPLCTTVINEATSDNIELCDDFKPKNHPVFNVQKLIFTDRKNLKVTTEQNELTEVNVVWYVNKDSPSSETECNSTYMAKDNETSECSVIFDTPLEGDSSVLKVLLVRTDGSSGNVIESSVLLVDDLVFNASKLSEDSLMVNWTASDNKYTATLLDLSLVVNDRNRVMTENTDPITSDIVCDEKYICFAHFFDLSPSHGYSLSVQKKDDEVSKAEIKYDLRNVSVEEGNDLVMTKVTKINSTTTKVVLDTKITSGTLSVVMNTDEAVELKTLGVSSNTFQFTNECPIFDVPKEVHFIILAQKEETKYIEQVVLNLKHLDSSAAWVGAEYGQANASLRVDTGGQSSVNVGDKICFKSMSPCYFIEDQSLPETVERCINLEAGSTNKRVQQCDEEITSYKELNVTDIALEDGQIKVTAASNDTQVTFEVTIYDLKNPSNIYSIEAAHCDSEVEETIICKQQLILPNDRRPLKVLVSEIHKDGTVLKSSLSPFYFPDNKSTDTWIIVVSVLGSVFGASLIVFIIVITVKKKKSLKSTNTMGEKELSVLSEANRDDTPPRIASAANRDSYFEDLDSRPLPKESRLYSRKSNAPQPPVKAPDRMSRNDESPYSRKPDSPPPTRKSEGLPRKHYAPFSGRYDALLKGYDNKGYSSSPRPEEAPCRLPRIMPKPNPSNSRVPPSSEYY